MIAYPDQWCPVWGPTHAWVFGDPRRVPEVGRGVKGVAGGEGECSFWGAEWGGVLRCGLAVKSRSPECHPAPTQLPRPPPWVSGQRGDHRSACLRRVGGSWRSVGGPSLTVLSSDSPAAAGGRCPLTRRQGPAWRVCRAGGKAAAGGEPLPVSRAAVSPWASVVTAYSHWEVKPQEGLRGVAPGTPGGGTGGDLEAPEFQI